MHSGTDLVPQISHPCVLLSIFIDHPPPSTFGDPPSRALRPLHSLEPLLRCVHCPPRVTSPCTRCRSQRARIHARQKSPRTATSTSTRHITRFTLVPCFIFPIPRLARALLLPTWSLLLDSDLPSFHRPLAGVHRQLQRRRHPKGSRFFLSVSLRMPLKHFLPSSSTHQLDVFSLDPLGSAPYPCVSRIALDRRLPVPSIL